MIIKLTGNTCRYHTTRYFTILLIILLIWQNICLASPYPINQHAKSNSILTSEKLAPESPFILGGPKWDKFNDALLKKHPTRVSRGTVPPRTIARTVLESLRSEAADNETDRIAFNLLARLLNVAEIPEIDLSGVSYSPDQPENTKAVRNNNTAFEYHDSARDFHGIDLEHFISAQIKLAKTTLSDAQLAAISTELGLPDTIAREAVYTELAAGHYTRNIIDIINNNKYTRQRPDVEIDAQNSSPKEQGVYEAVANSLDALGCQIGRFGKGVKQLMSWLEATGIDRIDVYTRTKHGTSYQLTILQDPVGQNYIQIRQIDHPGSYREYIESQGIEIPFENLDHGTIVSVTTKAALPLEGEDTDSQEKIENGIHKRFPFITSVGITTEIEGRERREVNGFHSKRVISSDEETASFSAEDSSDKNVHVSIADRKITIIDNGKGMNEETVSRMFVSGLGDKPRVQLNWNDPEAAQEKDKIAGVYDESLPHRISFARSGEVVLAIDIPKDIIPAAVTPKGGLMVELGRFMRVPESRDAIRLDNNFQEAVLYLIDKIRHRENLPPEEKLQYINTIVVGLDQLMQNNKQYEIRIKAIRQKIRDRLMEEDGVVAQLRKDNFFLLPHESQFAKINVPEGLKPVYLHEKIFDWGTGKKHLPAIAGVHIPGLTFGGDAELSLFMVPFTPASLEYVRQYSKDWHKAAITEQFPIIKTDSFIAIPAEFGTRLRELALQRKKEELSPEDNEEYLHLVQLLQIITAERVTTSYESVPVAANVSLDDTSPSETDDPETTDTAPDAKLAKRFLLSNKKFARIPADANQKLILLENGDIIDVATGERRDINESEWPNEKHVEIQALTNSYYKIVTVTESGTHIEKLVHYNGSKSLTLCTGIAEDTGNLVISPDRKFAFVRNKNTQTKPEVAENKIYDLEMEQEHTLDDFPPIEVRELPEECLFTKTQFHPNSKYLTYIKTEHWPTETKTYFVIVNLEDRNIKHKIPLPVAAVQQATSSSPTIKYAVNPFNPDLIYLQYTCRGNIRKLGTKDPYLMSFIDINRGEEIGPILHWNGRPSENIQHLHTDPLGNYTVAITTEEKMYVYVHETGELITELPTKQPIAGVVTCFMKNGQSVSLLGDPDDNFFNVENKNSFQLDQSHVQFYIVHDTESFGFRQNNKDHFIPYTDRDPFQSLTEGNVCYYSPEHKLIIHHSATEPEITVINPATNATGSFPGRGEIVCHHSNFAKYYYEGDIYENDFQNPLPVYPATSPETISYGSQPYKFWISKKTEHSEQDAVTNYRLESDIATPAPAILDIPLGFTQISFDGKYFVFVNPETGDTIYLDPIWHITPSHPDCGKLYKILRPIHAKDDESTQQQDPEEDPEFQEKRTAWLGQLRSVLEPLFDLVDNTEYASYIYTNFLPRIEGLYEDQEKAIFAKGINNTDTTDPELPFTRFCQNMNRMLPILQEYLTTNHHNIDQETGQTQKIFYAHLFTEVVNFCLHAENVPAALWENDRLLDAFAFGFHCYNQDHVSALTDICNFLEISKEIESADLETKTIIVYVLGFLIHKKKTQVMQKQLRKLLSIPAGPRKILLDKFHLSFIPIQRFHLISYLDDGKHGEQLGDAKVFIDFLSNESELVERKKNPEPDIPSGVNTLLPLTTVAGETVHGLQLSPIVLLEEDRQKNHDDPDDIVMSLDYLIAAIERDSAGEEKLPEPDEELESSILENTTLQRESGAYTAEIPQNSYDATQARIKQEETTTTPGELHIRFYMQEGEDGEEYVEEAQDNGTGALHEVALLIPQSTKDEGEQIDVAGFFGTGKYTIFEGVDRVEIITKNTAGRNYMFTLEVLKDNQGIPQTVLLTGIRKITDPALDNLISKHGVIVRRIKKAKNTIPELEKFIAQRQWKTFAGIVHASSTFKIFFVDQEGNKEPLVKDGELEVLSETDFIAPDFNDKDEETTNFGKCRIWSTKDMPLQLVDKRGLRVSSLEEKEDRYLTLIPPALRPHLKELGIVIQIPLPLTRSRDGFKHENDFLPYIRKYIAIEFLKAIAYKTLTSTGTGSQQFVFENFSLEWETNFAYWDNINLSDGNITKLANKINGQEYSRIDGKRELEPLKVAPGELDKTQDLLKLLLLLEVTTDHAAGKQESLLSRRIALLKKAGGLAAAIAQEQQQLMSAAGYEQQASSSATDIPDYKLRLQQIRREEQRQDIVIEDLIIPEAELSPKERAFLDQARQQIRLFGLKNIFLVRENLPGEGMFALYNGERTIFLNIRVLQRQTSGHSIFNNRTETIVHEIGHSLEADIEEEKWQQGFIFGTNFTHSQTGTFAIAMKYAAFGLLANHGNENPSLPDLSDHESAPAESQELGTNATEPTLELPVDDLRELLQLDDKGAIYHQLCEILDNESENLSSDMYQLLLAGKPKRAELQARFEIIFTAAATVTQAIEEFRTALPTIDNEEVQENLIAYATFMRLQARADDQSPEAQSPEAPAVPESLDLPPATPASLAPMETPIAI